MASIENRSHFQVTVKNRDDLTKSFAYNSKPKAEQYLQAWKLRSSSPNFPGLTTTTSSASANQGLKSKCSKRLR